MTVIAVDGPAASGKGTISARIAARYGFHYLDTGALYRAVASRVLGAGGDPADADTAREAALALTPDDLDRHDLRLAHVAKAASVVAANGAVRSALVAFQREFAARAPGAVLDGRDIGTVICPDADAKLFVTAELDTRAERRWNQRVARGEAVMIEEVRDDIAERDARDSNRADAPMRQAADAALLDTTNLSIEQSVESAFASIESQLTRSG